MSKSSYVYEADELRRFEQRAEGGDLDGPYIEYHENEVVRVVGCHALGVPTGNWLYFSSSGRLMECGRVGPSGNEGIWHRYRPEGTIWETVEYKKGVLDGAYRVYSKAGLLVASGVFRDGFPFEGFCYEDGFDKQPDGGYTSYGIYYEGNRLRDASYPKGA